MLENINPNIPIIYRKILKDGIAVVWEEQGDSSSTPGRIYMSKMMTEEKVMRQNLIDLGWTPPRKDMPE